MAYEMEIFNELKKINLYKKCDFIRNTINDKFITVHSHGPNNTPEVAHIRIGDISALEEINDTSTKYKTSILLKPLQKSFFVEESYDEIMKMIDQKSLDMNDLLNYVKGFDYL